MARMKVCGKRGTKSFPLLTMTMGFSRIGVERIARFFEEHPDYAFWVDRPKRI